MSYPQLLIDHYQKTWGPAIQEVRLQEGRIHDLPADFRVLVFQPHPAEEVYATCCMSQPADEARLELHWMASKNLEKSTTLSCSCTLSHTSIARERHWVAGTPSILGNPGNQGLAALTDLFPCPT